MMAPGVVKRIRLDRAEARLLAAVAKEQGVPESEVLREALRMIGRMRARERNIHKLIALADIGKEDAIKFELK